MNPRFRRIVDLAAPRYPDVEFWDFVRLGRRYNSKDSQWLVMLRGGRILRFVSCRVRTDGSTTKLIFWDETAPRRWKRYTWTRRVPPAEGFVIIGIRPIERMWP